MIVTPLLATIASFFQGSQGVLELTEDRNVLFLILGVLGVLLLIWGLVKRLVKLAVFAAILGAAAWYFYFSPPS